MRIILTTALVLSLLGVPHLADAQGNSKIADMEDEACHVCGDAGDDGLLDKPYCRELSSEIEDIYFMQDGNCRDAQYSWSKICCEVELSFEISLPDPGTHPICNVCPESEFPRVPGLLLNFLHVGVGSCAQYWEAGKLGQLKMDCDAVQFFANDYCNCGPLTEM